MATHVDNLTVPKGKIYFDPFVPGTTTKTGERYFGNTPTFTISTSTESLDHFSSEGGIKEKDRSLAISTTRTGTLSTDNVDAENLAILLFGEAATLTFSASTVTDEAHADVIQGRYYQLGESDLVPSGARGLVVHTAPSTKVVVKTGSTTHTEGEDYEIDMELGRLYIVPGGGIADGDDITVSYKVGAHTREQVISGDDSIEGAIRFVADNPVGVNRDVYIPRVKLTPNGDFVLKSDTWQEMQFNLEVLKLNGRVAIYADGRPV